ncbi:MAG: peroxiredoxin [Janthinobacterium lividum]
MSFEIGQPAPSFELRVDDHKTVNLTDYQGKKLILYFYPADDTPGCTLESCGFRDYYPEIKKLGAEILGVSRDNLESHKKFKTKYALPFDLGADEDGKVSTLYQALRAKEPTKSQEFVRSTFLIDETGHVRKWWPKVTVSGHLPEILAALKEA